MEVLRNLGLVVAFIGGITTFVRWISDRPNMKYVRPVGTSGIVASLILIGASILMPPTSHSTVIEIASDLPVSGYDQLDGLPVQNGVELAVHEANVDHIIPGYTLEYNKPKEAKDDVGSNLVHDPNAGKANVTMLIDDALVAGIVGPMNSSVAEAEMPIANQAPIALISPSNTNPCLTVNTANVGCTGKNNLLPIVRPTGKVTYFRITATDNQQGAAGADYLIKQKHYKTVYVIYDNNDIYSQGLATAFIKEWNLLGGTVLGSSNVPGTTTNYVPRLTTISAKHPDVIYFAGDTPAATFAREDMDKVAGLKNTPYASGDGIVNNGFVTSIGLQGGPIYATVPVGPATQEFITHYQAAYGDNYTPYSASGYDCAGILIQAIKKALLMGAKTPRDSHDIAGAREFRQKVIDAIQGISYNGVTGSITFDTSGDTQNDVVSIYTLALVNGKPDWEFLSQRTWR